MAGGRPTIYTKDVADTICGRIVAGESLRRICADDDMPAASSVFKWLRENDEFSQQYAKAKEEQAEGFADELVSIADEREYEKVEVDGVPLAVKFDATAVARNRLRVDTRKWVASKLLPKKYGERSQVDHTIVGLEALVAADEPDKP